MKPYPSFKRQTYHLHKHLLHVAVICMYLAQESPHWGGLLSWFLLAAYEQHPQIIQYEQY